jgi:hypothetical protein
VASVRVREAAQSFQERALSISLSIDRSMDLPRDCCLYAFEESFSIRQCDGELCGENAAHAQTRKASMTAAAATAFLQRVVSKESSLDDACMTWRQLQANEHLSLSLSLSSCLHAFSQILRWMTIGSRNNFMQKLCCRSIQGRSSLVKQYIITVRFLASNNVEKL